MNVRPNLVLTAVGVLVLLLAGVAGFLAAKDRSVELDPATPEAAAQMYVAAVIARDGEAAASLLAPGSQCDNLLDYYAPDAASITVQKVTLSNNGESAEVTLEISERTDAFSEWTHGEVFTLTKTGDQWLVTGDPWPNYGCG